MFNARVQADWKKLIMANYVVDPAFLLPYVPAGTELDLWEGQCYVSLVGFLFKKSKLNGIPIPFHHSFEEVNLRFYVSRMEGDLRKRGVVFIKEIVPKPAVTFVANQIFHEHYETVSMRHHWRAENEILHIAYQWQNKHWHSMAIQSEKKMHPLAPGSMEEFFTEHYWGYTQLNMTSTLEYFVDHHPWEVYKTIGFQVDVDFGINYGPSFNFLTHQKPDTVFLAEGSEISLQKSQLIRKA